MTTAINPLGWLSGAASLLFGQAEPSGTRSTTGYSQGQDIPLALDTPVGNILPGTVVRANYAPWGGQVDVQTQIGGKPTVEEYLHLDQIYVGVGQFVGQGTVVGLSGGQLSGGAHPATSQYSTGPHIKYSLFQGASDAQIQAGNWGKAIDPAPILQAAQKLFGGIGTPSVPLTIGIPGASALDTIAGTLTSGVGFLVGSRFPKIVFGVLLVVMALILFLFQHVEKIVPVAVDAATAAGVGA